MKKIKKYYSCSEIREMILKEKKLPLVTGNKGYLTPIFGGKDKIILK